MIQTPTTEAPHVVCEACKARHDLASWKTLRICRGGTGGTSINGQKSVTYLTQGRLCPCGAVIDVKVSLPAGTTPSQAEATLALSVLGEGTSG